MLGECGRLPERQVNFGLRVRAQGVGSGIGDDADDLDRMSGVSRELHLPPDGIGVREVAPCHGRIDDRHARRRFIVRRAEGAPVHQRHAHDREVVLRDRSQRQGDAIGERRRPGPAWDLHLAGPLVARQRHAPREGRVADARNRGDAIEGLRMERLPSLALHRGNRHRQDVLRLVPWPNAFEVPRRANQQCRAREKREGQRNLECRHGAEQPAFARGPLCCGCPSRSATDREPTRASPEGRRR